MDVEPLVGRPLGYGDKVQAGGYQDGEKILTLEYKSKPQSHYGLNILHSQPANMFPYIVLYNNTLCICVFLSTPILAIEFQSYELMSELQPYRGRGCLLKTILLLLSSLP